ncbi:MAG: MFS transporter [Thermoleophilia bacterium]|nr:MFS transporter [Thermoleophilia bacterium]
MNGSPRPLFGRFGPQMTPDRIAFAGIFVVTGLGLLTIGATLPVLPKYVTGPIGGGDVAVGVVTGAFAATGLLFRPIGGAFADARGRKPVVVVGALLTALSGLLLFIPAGIGGLVITRLFLGAGEGMVYTAGAAWIVDMAPAHRRGRVIGLYGLAIWGGLSLGPPIGDLILRTSSFEMVWAFAAAAPLAGALIATRIPENYAPAALAKPISLGQRARALIARESLAPGLALALTVVGYATLAAFIVLHLDARGIGHGALVFATFAVTVVTVRLLGGGLPDRYGGARTAAVAGLVQAGGLFLVAAAHSLPVALIGAAAMGGGFALLFPSLALIVVDAVPDDRRGAALGTFTAFFDVGMGVGAPLAGVAAVAGGYGLSFALAGVVGLGTVVMALALHRAPHLQPAST